MSYTDFSALPSLAISLDRAGSRSTIDHEDTKDPVVPTGSIPMIRDACMRRVV